MRSGTGPASAAKRQSTHAAAAPASAGTTRRKIAPSTAVAVGAGGGVSARQLVRIHLADRAERKRREQATERRQRASAPETLPQLHVARRAGKRARLGIELPRMAVHDRG